MLPSTQFNSFFPPPLGVLPSTLRGFVYISDTFTWHGLSGHYTVPLNAGLGTDSSTQRGFVR